MGDLASNLLASLIAAAAGLIGQWLLGRRRRVRRREFFGIVPGAAAELFVARHASSPHRLSVHRSDVAALVELSTIIRECGGRPSLLAGDEPRRESGRGAEFCVGGPWTNARTAAHLRSALPGIRLTGRAGNAEGSLWIGEDEYRCRPGAEEFAVLARVRPVGAAFPTFLLVGQVAVANLAAARHLAAEHRSLRRQFGTRDDFALLLRVKESDTFGPDQIEVLGDHLGAARSASPSSSPPGVDPLWSRGGGEGDEVLDSSS